MKRYYYKAKEGKGYLNLKSPLKGKELEKYTELTEEQFAAETIVPPHEETEASRKRKRIAELKGNLARTDYVVIKIAEGAATVEEYAEVIAQRQAWRAEINELE